MTEDPAVVVRAFVEAINSGSSGQVAALMTKNHLFVDSDGTESLGRSAVAAAWGAYFDLVPDYRITIGEILAAGGTVLLAGQAEGTFVRDGTLRAEDHWRVPAAWKAVVDRDRVAHWQVFVNPEPLTRILENIGGSDGRHR